MRDKLRTENPELMQDGIVQRPRELEDFLNRRIYHPLSARLARSLRESFVTPNMLSVCGAILVVAAGISYAALPYPVSVLLGLLLHMSWHVLDGADGDLARLTGRAGPQGELVDGICDYASHIALYVILAIVLQESIGIVAWPLVLLAGLSHALQNLHYEIYRRQYQHWVYRKPWLGQSVEKQSRDSEPHGQSGLVSAYVGAANLISPHGQRISQIVEESWRSGTGPHFGKEALGKILPWLSLFGSNYRTLALGAAFAVQSPILFVFYEVVVLNVLLIGASVRVRSHLRGLIEAA